MADRAGTKLIASNKTAHHRFHFEEKYEAGIVLMGSEVKSLRAARVNLKDSYATIREGEVWLLNCHISPYEQATHVRHEPLRERKLLMHRAEIRRLIGKVREKGYSLIPIAMYFRGGRAKVELGLGKGKQLHDRRREIAEESARREVRDAMGRKQKGRTD